LATVMNAAIANKQRFDTMHAFFGPVGKDHAAGVWEQGGAGVPQDRPEFKEHTRRHVIKLMKKRKAEEMI
jgi:3,8-divinyl chlorophyllide a/chlorophyllide a reductase subunit Y